MTKLILIRHGQTEWNISGKYQGQSDIPLSLIGLKQAELLAQFFPIKKIDVIYSSPLIRAATTANCISNHFKKKVILDNAFKEISFGDWEGLTYEQIIIQWEDALEKFFHRPDLLIIPNGETFYQLQQRAIERLNTILDIHQNKNIVIVAHGAIIRTIIATLIHLPLRYIWNLKQDNTAVNILLGDTNSMILSSFNDTSHLNGTNFQNLTKI